MSKPGVGLRVNNFCCQLQVSDGDTESVQDCRKFEGFKSCKRKMKAG
jgi:hypothetical protein